MRVFRHVQQQEEHSQDQVQDMVAASAEHNQQQEEEEDKGISGVIFREVLVLPNKGKFTKARTTHIW